MSAGAALDPAPPAPLARDGVRALGLGILALAALLAWRLGLGLWGALGTDAPLWGLSAASMAHGAPGAVPPLWPGTVALLHGGLGLDLVPAAWGASLAAATLVPPAAFLLARRAGAAPRAAVVLGLLLAVHPELLAWGSEVQSNSLTALGLVGVALAWTAAAATERRGLPWLAVLAAGLLPLVRETGLVVAVAAMVLAPLLQPRGWRLSLGVLAAWWLSPLLVGSLPGVTPVDVPWAARGGMALAALAPGDGALPNYVVEIDRADRDAYVGWLREGAVWRVAAYHAARSLRLAWDGWLVALAAALALAAHLVHARVPVSQRLRAPLAATLLALAPLAPALVLWTQRRHVLLLVPVLAALALAGLLPAAGRPRPHRAVQAVGLALLVLSLGTWPARWHTLADEQQGETRRARALAEVADLIARAEPPIRLLGGPIQDVGLYVPLPRHEPDGSAADDHTALVVPGRMGRGLVPPGWRQLGRTVADTAVYRPPDPAARCPDGVPERGTPYLSAGPIQARLVGCPEDE